MLECLNLTRPYRILSFVADKLSKIFFRALSFNSFIQNCNRRENVSAYYLGSLCYISECILRIITVLNQRVYGTVWNLQSIVIKT